MAYSKANIFIRESNTIKGQGFPGL
jgi:hypothetical protein